MYCLFTTLKIYCIMMFGTFVGPLTANANVLATPVQAETWGVTPNQAAYSVSGIPFQSLARISETFRYLPHWLASSSG